MLKHWKPVEEKDMLVSNAGRKTEQNQKNKQTNELIN